MLKHPTSEAARSRSLCAEAARAHRLARGVAHAERLARRKRSKIQGTRRSTKNGTSIRSRKNSKTDTSMSPFKPASSKTFFNRSASNESKELSKSGKTEKTSRVIAKVKQKARKNDENKNGTQNRRAIFAKTGAPTTRPRKECRELRLGAPLYKQRGSAIP